MHANVLAGLFITRSEAPSVKSSAGEVTNPEPWCNNTRSASNRTELRSLISEGKKPDPGQSGACI